MEFLCSNSITNIVAECKLWHLLEVARAVSFHMQVPKPFWSDAILISCYLVNRMSFTILGGFIPHWVLYLGWPLFSLSPQVFGCVCYVHALDPSHDKLNPCAIKCIFLGYSRTRKGYRCYSPTIHRQFVCGDVTFNKSLPYFTSPQSWREAQSVRIGH